MIVSCQECQTKFNLNDKLVTGSGTKVRCSKCRHVFIVYPPETDQLPSEPAPQTFEQRQPVFENAPHTAEQAKTGFEDDYAWNNQKDNDEQFGDDDFDLSIIDDFFKEDKSKTSTPDTAASDIDSPEVDESPNFSDSDDDFDFSKLDELFREEDIEETAPGTPPADIEIEDADTGDTFDDDEDLDLSEIEDFFKEDFSEKPAELQTDEIDSESDLSDIEEAKDLDLSDLESLLEGEITEDANESGADEDLDLDFGAISEEEANLDDIDDNFDLSDLDFELEPELGVDQQSAENLEKSPKSGESLEITDDLDSLELDLSDLELDLEAAEEEVSEKDEAAEDLDFDFALEDQNDSEEVNLDFVADEEGNNTRAETEEMFDLSDLNLDFELEEEKSPETADEAEAAFDLADIELEDAAMADDSEEDLELSDLELDFEAESSEAGDDQPEEILDLEMESEDMEAKDSESEDDEALDLSQLELDLDKEMAETGNQEEPLDFDLDLEGAGEPAETPELGTESSIDEELDLSDIEDALDIDAIDEDFDKETVQEESLDIDLDFDIDLDAKPSEEKVPEVVDELSFDDMADEDLTDAVDDEALVEVAELEAAEPADEAPSYEQEYDYQEEEEEEKPETVAQSAGLQGFNDKPFAPEQQLYSETPGMPKPKKGVGKPVLVFLILILLLGGAGGAAYYLHNTGIKIPFVSDYLDQYLKPEVPDPGNIKIKPSPDPRSEFIDNEKTGRLFVISGKIKNEYNHPRSFIRIKATIYTTGKKPYKTETVYCGNMIDSMMLASMNLQDINKKLMNRFGDNRSNLKVQPGKMLPYMVVFSNVPADLDEFSVEVVSSSPG